MKGGYSYKKKEAKCKFFFCILGDEYQKSVYLNESLKCGLLVIVIRAILIIYLPRNRT